MKRLFKILLIILFILILGIIGKQEQEQDKHYQNFSKDLYNYDYTLNN